MNDAYNKMKEATTSGDIAYARGEFGRTNPHAAARLKKEKEKKDKKDKKKKDESVMEALPGKIEETKQQIVKGFRNVIKEAGLSMDSFSKRFNVTSNLTPKECLIRYSNSEQDLMELTRRLPNDLGELELILSTLDEKRSLDTFDLLSKYKWLYGARLGSKRYGVIIIYEGSLDMNYVPKENLFVSDLFIIEELAKREDSIQVSGKKVFPKKGDTFSDSTYAILADILNSTIDKKKEED